MSTNEISNSSPTKMEVDVPGFLKRSNSAPMIHNLNTASSNASSPFSYRTGTACSSNFFNIEPRTRRFSASFTPRCLNATRALARIDQIRQEECTDMLDREVAHENKLHCTVRMSQSWEDLSLMLESSNKNDENGIIKQKCTGAPFEPINAYVSSFSSARSSPSPTRCHSGGIFRQCYSSSVFKTNLSPSPTRKAFATRRSLSPIAVRPSSLGSIKRKFDLIDNEPPAKRYGIGTGGSYTSQPKFERNSSPLPSSLSSVGTPESFSSADSPSGFSFNAPDSPYDQPMRDVSKADSNVA